MTADIINLAERRLRKADKVPPPEPELERGRLSPEILYDMALLMLGHPPAPAFKRALKERAPRETD